MFCSADLLLVEDSCIILSPIRNLSHSLQARAAHACHALQMAVTTRLPLDGVDRELISCYKLSNLVKLKAERMIGMLELTTD